MQIVAAIAHFVRPAEVAVRYDCVEWRKWWEVKGLEASEAGENEGAENDGQGSNDESYGDPDNSRDNYGQELVNDGDSNKRTSLQGVTPKAQCLKRSQQCRVVICTSAPSVAILSLQ